MPKPRAGAEEVLPRARRERARIRRRPGTATSSGSWEDFFRLVAQVQKELQKGSAGKKVTWEDLFGLVQQAENIEAFKGKSRGMLFAMPVQLVWDVGRDMILSPVVNGMFDNLARYGGRFRI